MRLRMRRWNDPAKPDDGERVLICRYRPRGLPKGQETWDVWLPALGPSRELHAAFYGKNGPPIGWEEYRERYLDEMKGQEALIAELAQKVRNGEMITLLCSSACVDESHCHRALLAALIEEAVAR